MKKINKIFARVFVFSTVATFAMAFDWPVKDFNVENFYPTFAQNRKQHFNTSLIFSEAQDVVSTDKGKLTVVITEHQSENNWFESTLGNCVVIAHEDNLCSVYGNLEKQNAINCTKKNTVNSGEFLGKSENSAWNENPGALEFQIADNSGKTFLNPLILMPRILGEVRISTDGLIIENKLGRPYELPSTRSLQAGVYKFYKNHRSDFPMQSSSVYVNGLEIERVNKDILKQEKSSLVILGQNSYVSSEFYPNTKQEFLGQILIPHGNNTVVVTLRDFFGNEKNVTYNIQGF